MGLIERSNVVLVPATVTPHGHTSPLFNRLLYGHHTDSHQVFRNRPNANICEESVQSTKVPHAMLGRANFVIWQTTHPKEFFGGSYKAMNPHTHYNQSFGLIMTLRSTRINPDDHTISPRHLSLQLSPCSSSWKTNLLSRYHTTPPMGCPTCPKTLLTNMLVLLEVYHPTRDITIVKHSKWILS